MSAPTVGITISMSADCDLAVEDVWPDGDAPEVITAEVVRDLMESLGRKEQVLRDWCLLDDLDVQVIVEQPNPDWKQDETLTGEAAPPRWLRSRADVWWLGWWKRARGIAS